MVSRLVTQPAVAAAGRPDSQDEPLARPWFPQIVRKNIQDFWPARRVEPFVDGVGGSRREHTLSAACQHEHPGENTAHRIDNVAVEICRNPHPVEYENNKWWASCPK